MTVRRADLEDVPRVAEVLAEAFSADPPMRWFLGAQRASPDVLRPYFRATLRHEYLPSGEVWVSEEPLGAAVWLKPDARFALRGRLAVLPASVRAFGRHPVRAALGQRAVGRGRPVEPHWYLDFIGVASAGRSRGVGSALLRPMLERCDAGRVAAALNAGSPRSRDLYLRHGFEVVERFTLPFDGPPLWRMWRRPGAVEA